jgi:tetratricopeptide (TPR) repeat protein
MVKRQNTAFSEGGEQSSAAAARRGEQGRRRAGSVSREQLAREIDEARALLDKGLSSECYRSDGDWRGLGEVYLGLGLVDVFEGQYESALDNYEQALKLMGERAAPQTLGRLYANMGGACWFIKRPHDGIRYLEKAVHYYERTEHKSNAATGYNNLGINLMLGGEWTRERISLKRRRRLSSTRRTPLPCTRRRSHRRARPR